MAKATRLIRPRTVTSDGEGLVSHAGLVWLGEVADHSGLTAGFRGQVWSSSTASGAPIRHTSPASPSPLPTLQPMLVAKHPAPRRTISRWPPCVSRSTR